MSGTDHDPHIFLLFIFGSGLILSTVFQLVKEYRLRVLTRIKIKNRIDQDTAHKLSLHENRKRLSSASIGGQNVIPVLVMALAGVALVHLAPMREWSAGPRIGIVMAAVYLGLRIPAMGRERRLAQYRAEVERDLPAMIDLLVVMLDAGSTFDDAMSRLVDDPHFPNGAIKQELARLTAELAITPQRYVAYQKFASATALNDLRLFVSVLVQSENFGTPVSKGLQSLAFEMRERLSNAVEAKGSALGPKLAVPMTIFFLPLIFIVVLTPTIIRAFHLP